MLPLRDQIAEAVAVRSRRRSGTPFLAYLQPGTNTHAETTALRAVFDEVVGHPAVAGLIVGTRPDCLPEATLDLLAEVAGRTWLLIEVGLQSMDDRSLAWLGRGHGYAAFVDAVARCRRRRLRLGVHLILGLPGETVDGSRTTAAEVSRLEVFSVKLHHLHAVRGTPLAAMVAGGTVRLPTADEYMEHVLAFLEHLRPECVVDRLVGEARRPYLVAPLWSEQKSAILAKIDAEMARRDTWQGKCRG